MNTPVEQMKTAAAAELRLLRSDLEEAVSSHKWYFLAGLVIGVIVGAFLAHAL